MLTVRANIFKATDLMPKGSSPITRFTTWLAVKVTNGVGTM